MAQQYMWFEGKFVKFEDAKVHILTHSLQYGSGVFEGLRCYSTNKGPAIFRLHEHAKRFAHSLKIYGFPMAISTKQFEKVAVELIRKNKLESAYIRPFAFYDQVGVGFNVMGKSTSFAMAAIKFDQLYKNDHTGLRCKVSSWLRINSTLLPAGAKISGNYINSILASQEAHNSGYDEAIMMSGTGNVAEGPADNIFVVQDNVLLTPPKSANILLGITRDSIITVAESMGIEVVERDIRREELYTSDELFFTGTASGIVPIISVDSREVGNGKCGSVTEMLRQRYEKIRNGQDAEFMHWLTFVRG